MKRTIAGAMLLGLLSASFAEAETGIFDFLKKKKKVSPQTEQKGSSSQSSYERILSAKKETAESKLLKLHKTDGKIYLELYKASLGKDMLLGLTMGATSDPNMTTVGFVNGGPIHIRFIQRDSAIVMQAVNTELLDAERKNPRLARSIKQNYSDLAFLSFPIKGYSKDSTSLLIDASSFFLRENRYFPTISKGSPRFRFNNKEQSNLAQVKSVKAFDTNASIRVSRSFFVDASNANHQTVFKDYPVTVEANYTLLALPEEPMTPRLSDTRIGIFLSNKIAEEDGKIEAITLARRWRVEPADPVAYKAGKPSRPKKPIVFYIEDAFPSSWREAIRDGILRWNKAFERIGFQDAIVVKDFPKNDPHFDPDNLEYSCIRFVPQDTENAMGPSWVDPRTGEIINGSVFVYRDVTNLLNRWRFVQTAQLDPEVRSKVMSEKVLKRSLEYVMAHEIGHTLGFMHNMAASSAYPVDSLRSVTFTHKYGTTPSIMDYARNNYVAQPEDKGVSLEPPFLGVYDYHLVDWLYRAYPDLRGDYKAEAERLRTKLDAHAGDPLYRYGIQQLDKVYDPSALSEDLGDDPVKAGEYGMRNLQYIISNIDNWIKDDEEGEHRSNLYQEALFQSIRYLSNNFDNIGGTYLYHTSEASGLPRYKVVPRDKQRASAQWLLYWAKNIDKLANKALEDKLPNAGLRPLSFVRRHAQILAMTRINQLATSYYLDSTSYSPIEYATDVFNSVWEKTLRGNDSQLTEAERSLQEAYVTYMVGQAERIGRDAPSGSSLGFADDRTEPFAQELAELRSLISPTHLCSLIGHQHSGDRAERGLLTFGAGYGEAGDIWDGAINRTRDYLYSFALKTKSLLEMASKGAKDPELKAYYSYQLSRLKALDKH